VVDVFEEVEEELRSARYQTIIKKAWPVVAGVLVVGVLATLAVWVWQKHQLSVAAHASETYQQGLEAQAKNDKAAAAKAFASVAEDGPPAYKALALMQQASILSSDGKTAEAVALLDKAGDAVKDPAVSDAAKMKAAYMAFDTASLADMEKRLDPLSKAGRPYATLAKEALAMKRLASGQTKAARDSLSVLTIAPDASQGLQARANIAMGVIDAGQAAGIPAAVAAAAKLPPSAAIPPAALPGGAPPVGSAPEVAAPAGAQQ
jgi:hypothetical protein